MSQTSGPEDLQAVDYAGVLRRRWWLVVAVAVIGTLGAVGYVLVGHKVYTATAAVYVTATAGTANQVANGRTTGAVNLDTEAQIVQSVMVAQGAAKLMHAKASPQQLITRVTVTVPSNSQVLSISCQAGTAPGAATCAQAFARAYLNYISSRTTSLVKDQILVLQNKISSLQSTSAKLSIEIASLPSNSSARASANQQLNSDNTQLASLNGQVAQMVEQLANPAGGSIISYASPPTSPTSPKALLVIPSGLVVGLLVGLVAAFVVDRRDRRIRGPRDVTRLNLPVLMSLPLKNTPELAIAAPRSLAGREFSELAHVLTGSLEAGNHVIVVTGTSDGKGAGLVAANLAVALSRYQRDVTLVCANLGGSVIPDMVGVPSAPGLTDLLADEAPNLNRNVGWRPAAAPQLRVITPGSAAGPGAADLAPDGVDQLLVNLRDTARWIVVEAPPVASDPDVYTLTQAADAVVLVAEVPRTHRDELAAAVHHLERTGAAVLGAVLLPTPTDSGARGTPLSVGDSNFRLQGRELAARTAEGDLPEAEETRTSLRGS